MALYQRKKLTISLLIPFLVFALFFSIMIMRKYRSSSEIPLLPPSHNTEGRRLVTLFFATDGNQLVREARELDQCEIESDCLKSVLDELLNGPVGEFMETVPEGTIISTVSIDGDLATINFNRTFSEAMLAGSSAEMLAVFAVVNTVGTNFPRIQKVKIDIDNNKSAVLGHLDLSDPLQPDYTLEQTQIPSAENKSDKTTAISK